MTKDWEKDFEEIMIEYGYDGAVKPVKKWLAKQRTQLLARVREEVIDHEVELGKALFIDFKPKDFHLPSANAMKEYLLAEQLKKLEIISNECEHEPQLKTVEEEGHRYQVAGDICIKCQQLL